VAASLAEYKENVASQLKESMTLEIEEQSPVLKSKYDRVTSIIVRLG